MPTRTLWTDNGDEERELAWIAPRATAERHAAPPSAPPPPPRRSINRRRAVAGTVVAVALVALGAGGASILGGGDAPRERGTADPAVLPAASGAGSPTTRSDTVRTVYAAASPSVVSVRRGGGSGTGFLIDEDGTIVTNAHVVGNAGNVSVRLDDGGRDIQAEVLGSDPSTDLAVLQVSRSAASGIRPLPLADSNGVKVGDLAIAIGYPLGLDRTATAGIVSGLSRQIEAPNGFSIDKVIQTDAPINPGNSGGPLLDSAGRVIGVNSQIATTNGGSVGIGFAVPSNTVREVVPRLSKGESIRRGYLGVSTSPSPAGAGALVAEVKAGGPAAAAGIRRGDVIVGVGGDEVERPDDVGSAVVSRRPGESVAIEIERNGARRTVQVRLGDRPESP
ncbi:MAG TPA: trypsin-like peptidase domain-containing protein [Thermoleophilaceae bacterium]|nr:trypsin-like peptidase domain-containing protein [Thermoleophilaceae bacterium]